MKKTEKVPNYNLSKSKIFKSLGNQPKFTAKVDLNESKIKKLKEEGR